MSIKRENLILPFVAPAGTDYTDGNGKFVKADGSYAAADADVFGVITDVIDAGHAAVAARGYAGAVGVRLADGQVPSRGDTLGAGADGAAVGGGIAVALGASDDGEEVEAVLLPFSA